MREACAYARDERADPLHTIDDPFVARPLPEDRVERFVQQARRGRGLQSLELRILDGEAGHEVLQQLERGILGELEQLVRCRERSSRGLCGFDRERAGLDLTTMRPGEQARHSFRGEPPPHGARLLFTTRRQPIVVGLAVRGLAVADQVERAHAPRILPPGRGAASTYTRGTFAAHPRADGYKVRACARLPW